MLPSNSSTSPKTKLIASYCPLGLVNNWKNDALRCLLMMLLLLLYNRGGFDGLRTISNGLLNFEMAKDELSM